VPREVLFAKRKGNRGKGETATSAGCWVREVCVTEEVSHSTKLSLEKLRNDSMFSIQELAKEKKNNWHRTSHSSV